MKFLGGGSVEVGCDCNGDGGCRTKIEEGRYNDVIVTCEPLRSGCDGGCKDPAVVSRPAD